MSKQGKSVLVLALIKKKTSSKRLWFFSLVVFLFSVSLAAAQNKVVVIPLFDGQRGSPAPPAPVEKTGQKKSWAAGDDGDLLRGVAWPNPRFKDKGDGTVRDRLTGLIWMKNANCFGQRDWSTALADCQALADGACGLSDGSSAGDWGLANIKELHSLVHYGVLDPAVPNTLGTGKWAEGDPFIGVQSDYYWSSTNLPHCINCTWSVDFLWGIVTYRSLQTYYVWCVRGGQ